MPQVLFLPMGRSAEVSAGVSLLDAAEQMGIEMRHDCGGFATCSTCRVWIQEGMPHLSEIDLDEENMLEEAALSPPYRLSCQAKVMGDVTARIEGSEMDWSSGALRELEQLQAPFKALVRMIVEKRARMEGLSVILPDTAIPFVRDARQEVEAVSGHPPSLEAFIRRVHETP